MQPVDVIIAGAWLCLMWAVWFYGISPLIRDTFRQRIFELRADLFDMASAGQLSFDSLAYTELRMRLNAVISEASRFTLPRSLVLVRMTRSVDNEMRNDTRSWEAALGSVHPDVGKRLTAIHDAAISAIALRLFVPPLILVLPLLVPARLFLGLRGKLKAKAVAVEKAAVQEYRIETMLGTAAATA